MFLVCFSSGLIDPQPNRINSAALIQYACFSMPSSPVMLAGKDKLVKYWDADKFELLLTLAGHHAAVWCLAVSPLGDFIITGSHDRSLRRWDRTDEPFFVEEEKEARLDSLFEGDLAVSLCCSAGAAVCT